MSQCGESLQRNIHASDPTSQCCKYIWSFQWAELLKVIDTSYKDINGCVTGIVHQRGLKVS